MSGEIAEGPDRSSRFTASRREDRPRVRDGLSDVEEQIFAATEELLNEVGLSELGVSQICRRAKVARGTFYFYFSSKNAVVAGLLARVMDEIFKGIIPFAPGTGEANPVPAMRTGLQAGWGVWREHRVLLRATCENWAQVPELRDLWLSIMERFTQVIGDKIDRERAAGLASPGIESRRLAAMLVWSAERHAYVAGLGLDPELPDEDAIFDSVVQFWLRAIYAEIPAGMEAG